MASQFLRLRRALTSLSTVTRPLSSPVLPQSPSISSHLLKSSEFQSQSPPVPFLVKSRAISGTPISLSSGKQRQYKLYVEGDEITEDTILFEGCDYNHWLITVDFPKDPKPSPEEMVATYERICSQGLNISIEEAKKRIYACSTTTYQGFQAIMTEEESQKFEDIPGVVFVLPDSYIDPVNKEYGGDKYENGVITPRPPPVYQHRSSRNRDRQPRYDRQGAPMPNRQGGPMPNQQGSPQYNNQGPMQGAGRNYGPQQNYPPQQNYGPPQNYPPQQYPPQQNYGPPQNYPPQQNYGPPGQGERMPMNNRGYAPGGTYDGNRRGPMPPSQGNYNQPQQGNPYFQDQRSFQENPYAQGTNTGHGQGYPGEGPRFSPMEQNDMQGQGQQGSYNNMGQYGRDQGRY